MGIGVLPRWNDFGSSNDQRHVLLRERKTTAMSALQNRKVAAITVAMCVGLGAAACSSSGGTKASGATPTVGTPSAPNTNGVADGQPLDPNTAVTVSIDCAPAADKP